jgi:chemotaxis protein CheX
MALTQPPAERTPPPRAGVNIEYINAFIESVVSIFTTMLNENPVREKILLKVPGEQDYGVSGIVGLAGEASGSVVLNLDEHTAMAVVGTFTGDTYTKVSSDVIDGIGELTNMIAGDAKNRLHVKGYHFDISLPRVVAGRSFITACPKGSPCVIVKFTSGLGRFSLEVSLQKDR